MTTNDRFALINPIWIGDGVALDIHFRMLQSHELAAAQGFPSDYQFKGGKKEIIKQIGNAVAVGQAKALCSVLI